MMIGSADRAITSTVVSKPSMPGMSASMSTTSGLEHADHAQRLAAAGRLADDGDVALRGEQPAQARPHLGTVVHEQDVDHRSRT